MGYPGGKAGSGVYQTIINLMEPHDVYIEPFLGGGAVMRMKRPARLNIGLDLVASAVEEVEATIVYNGESAGGIAVPRAMSSSGDERSLNNQSVGGRRRATADLTVPAGSVRNGVGIPSAERERCAIARIDEPSVSGSRLAQPGGSSGNGGPAPASLVMADYRFECRDALEFLESYHPEGATVIYCDPPYLRSTRKGGRLYEHEMSDVDHLRLLRACRELAAKKCHILISGYSSPIYAKELKGWNATAYQAGTRRGGAAEWIWYNFPRPTELHDYRFLGDNFRERERIRRQQKRWRAKLQRMNMLQRQALLSVLNELHGFEYHSDTRPI